MRPSRRKTVHGSPETETMIPMIFYQQRRTPSKPWRRQYSTTRRDIYFSKKLIRGFVEKLVKTTFHSFSLNTDFVWQSCFPSLPGDCFFQSPCKCLTKPDEPSTVYIMTMCSHKLYTNIVETSRNTRQFSDILDIGGGSSFIRFNEFPSLSKERIKPLDCSVIFQKRRK